MDFTYSPNGLSTIFLSRFWETCKLKCNLLFFILRERNTKMSQVSAKQGTTATFVFNQQQDKPQSFQDDYGTGNETIDNANEIKLPRPIQFLAVSVCNAACGRLAKVDQDTLTFNKFFDECRKVYSPDADIKWVSAAEIEDCIAFYKFCLKYILNNALETELSDEEFEACLNDEQTYQDTIMEFRDTLQDQAYLEPYEHTKCKGDESANAPEPLFICLMQYDKETTKFESQGKTMYGRKGKVHRMARVEFGYESKMKSGMKKDELIECLTKHCKIIELRGFPFKHTIIKSSDELKTLDSLNEFQLSVLTRKPSKTNHYNPGFYRFAHSDEVLSMHNEDAYKHTFLDYVLNFKNIVNAGRWKKTFQGNVEGTSMRKITNLAKAFAAGQK